jgi:hypothetical protein
VAVMAKYLLRYWFEHGGNCLWSANQDARDIFGYPINYDKLPILKGLAEELNSKWLLWVLITFVASYVTLKKSSFYNREHCQNSSTTVNE